MRLIALIRRRLSAGGFDDGEVLVSEHHDTPQFVVQGRAGCGTTPRVRTADGQLYLVMAYYEGETLKERIARGPLALDEAVDIATQVGQGLSKAHAAGIVHRDIKPANLIVTADGTVKILDFGLAKLAGAEGVTQTGTTVGTVAYMSPEQAKGKTADRRSDVWAFGAVLYEMLAGRQAFQGEDVSDTLVSVFRDDPDWSRLSDDVPVWGGTGSPV